MTLQRHSEVPEGAKEGRATPTLCAVEWELDRNYGPGDN